MENTDLKLSDFDYELPQDLIAQYPAAARDRSRLLVLNRDNGNIQHKVFKDIASFFNKGDIVVLNNTKVFKARLLGRRENFTGVVEILLEHRIEDKLYEALCRPSRKLKIGTKLLFGEGKLKAQVVGEKGEYKVIRFFTDEDFYELLDEFGKLPLPSYIKREPGKEDEERYQTVFAKEIGAIAAPTAGLHFTDEVIDELTKKGVLVEYLTLHVGYGTFKPVKTENISGHKMHREYYDISKSTATRINTAKAKGNRIIAVGTTVCRALEASTFLRNTQCLIRSTQDWTDIFIYPGYDFKITDVLLTNFHLPKTTLLMLVSAFAGYKKILDAYKEAVKEKYRFFSYGDCMLIL
ncbi:MAG: tRNA preQ1(34) S-adenosylmethionine ribosyltransferase-isomerase QueA [Candidatus Omnitrophota bacterium]